jgi:hypothetical protein
LMKRPPHEIERLRAAIAAARIGRAGALAAAA